MSTCWRCSTRARSPCTSTSSRPARRSMYAGRVDLFFDNTTTARPFIADGRVKPFVTSGSVRDSLLPDVPTASEAGLPDLVLDSWLGLFAPAKTPHDIVERLRSATLKAVADAAVRRRLEATGWGVLSMSPGETPAL